MTATKSSDTPSFQRPLLSEPHVIPRSTDAEYVVVLPPYPPPERHRLLSRRGRCCLLFFASSIVFLAAAGYLLWPYDPKISIVRVRLDRLRFHRLPKLSVDLTLDLTVRVWNGDFYSFNYDSLAVAVGYRGKTLGFATSDGGCVDARRISYVNATLQLDRVEILSDVIFLIEDLAKGSVAFEAQSEIGGKLGFFFIELPIKAQVECEVIVDTRSRNVSQQSCYPEIGEAS